MLHMLLAQILEHYKLEDFVEDFAELEMLMQQHADLPKLVNYVIQLLKKASAPSKHVFIVLDALDECTQKSRRESITAVHELASAGSKISIFGTSREEQDIVDVLGDLSTISLGNETSRVQVDITSTLLEKSKSM